MANEFTGFPTEAIDFLEQIKTNNNRDWFLAHKNIYEEKVKGALVRFLEVLKPRLAKFAPEIEVNPAKAIFRIYRDIRFSQDKSPYKTHVAASLPSKDMKDGMGAVLYFHLESTEVLIAGGLYHPPSTALLAVRQYIAENSRKLRTIIDSTKFKNQFGGLRGEQLIRVPKGFAADHPAADLLRFKDYLAYVECPPKLATSPEIVPFTLQVFRDVMPLVRFLNAGIQRAPRKSF